MGNYQLQEETQNSLQSSRSAYQHSTMSLKIEIIQETPHEEVEVNEQLGHERPVGWVVKGTAFIVRFRLVSPSKVKPSWSDAQFSLDLILEDTYATVTNIDNPISYEAAPSNKDPSIFICHVKIHVLTTHVKSLIMLKASVTFPGQKTIEVLGHPLKIVSKPEQIRRRRVASNQEAEPEGTKKRARAAEITEKLLTLEQEMLSVGSELAAMRRNHSTLAHDGGAADHDAHTEHSSYSPQHSNFDDSQIHPMIDSHGHDMDIDSISGDEPSFASTGHSTLSDTMSDISDNETTGPFATLAEALRIYQSMDATYTSPQLEQLKSILTQIPSHSLSVDSDY